MSERIDITANRQTSNYSAGEMAARVLWGFGALLFRCSPRIAFGFRRVLLRCFGAEIGKQVRMYPSVIIEQPWNLSVGNFSAVGERAVLYCLGKVKIGERVTISQGAHLCAGSHDDQDPALPLLKLPIVLEEEVWVCADAFVGPDVTVHRGSVVGARAVVCKDVDAWKVVAGNPARIIRNRVIGGRGDTAEDQ